MTLPNFLAIKHTEVKFVRIVKSDWLKTVIIFLATGGFVLNVHNIM